MTKKTPTPIETVRIRSIFGTPDTCSARICRSGSEMVAKIPIIKLIPVISQIFPELASEEPSLLPRGCIDISAPIVKMASPAIRQSTPSKKSKKVLGDMGVSVMLSKRTMAAIGSIDVMDS